jgi:hypothetical protein
MRESSMLSCQLHNLSALALGKEHSKYYSRSQDTMLLEVSPEDVGSRFLQNISTYLPH